MANNRYAHFGLALVLALVLVQCDAFNSEPNCQIYSSPNLGQDSTLFIGKWEWAYSNQPSGGDCVFNTPETSGFAKTIDVRGENTLIQTHVGSIMRVDTLSYRFGPEDFSPGGIALFLFGADYHFYLNTDTLVMDTRHRDGPQEIFVRR